MDMNNETQLSSSGDKKRERIKRNRYSKLTSEGGRKDEGGGFDTTPRFAKKLKVF